MADGRALKVTIASAVEGAVEQAVASEIAAISTAAAEEATMLVAEAAYEESEEKSEEEPEKESGKESEEKAATTEQEPEKQENAAQAAPAATAHRPKKAAAAAAAPAAIPVKPIRKPKPFMTWLGQFFPGHEHAVLGGFCGLCVAVLVFFIGVPRTLFLLIVVVMGVIIGQYLDGDPRLVNAVRRLLGGDRP